MAIVHEVVIVKSALNAETMQRITDCNTFMPYAERPFSCTETAMRVLGILSDHSFQEAANGHRRGRYGLSTIESVESLMSRATTIIVVMRRITIEEVYTQIRPNEAALLLCAPSLTMIGGHSMIAATSVGVDGINVPVLIEATSTPVEQTIGLDAIREYFTRVGYGAFWVPVAIKAALAQARGASIGGKKPTPQMIRLNTIISNLIDQCACSDAIYAILGSVMNKVFLNLVLTKHEIQLTLSSTNVSDLLTGMNPNSATVIFDKGHAMVLVKKNDLILMDPKSGRKIMGLKNVSKYLDDVTLVLMSNSKTGKKITKHKNRKRSYRNF